MTVVERYLELALRLGVHVDGLVDAYYGPPELAERVARERPLEPAALAGTAGTLRAELAAADGEELPPQRRRWLDAQLAGLECAARRLAGDEIAYVDEVERCYGVRPQWTPEATFAAAHDRLDDALPGDGPLGERYEAWKDSANVPTGHIAEAFAALAEDCRARTARLVGLPAGEEVAIELVRDEPWEAFNYYRGGLRSRVAVNVDLPVRATLLTTLVTHECYPGHHTERVSKEALLVRGRGWLEETIVLVATPQSTISEGIAEVAGEVLLGDDEEVVTARHLRPLGIPYDPEVVAAVRHAVDDLRAVGTNAALLLHERGAPLDEVREYSMRWGLASSERAAKGLAFLTDPTWRAYVPCYSEGRRLARGFVAGDPARFRRLLVEQLVPADLLASG